MITSAGSPRHRARLSSCRTPPPAQISWVFGLPHTLAAARLSIDGFQDRRRPPSTSYSISQVHIRGICVAVDRHHRPAPEGMQGAHPAHLFGESVSVISVTRGREHPPEAKPIRENADSNPRSSGIRTTRVMTEAGAHADRSRRINDNASRRVRKVMGRSAGRIIKSSADGPQEQTRNLEIPRCANCN